MSERRNGTPSTLKVSAVCRYIKKIVCVMDNCRKTFGGTVCVCLLLVVVKECSCKQDGGRVSVCLVDEGDVEER